MLQSINAVNLLVLQPQLNQNLNKQLNYKLRQHVQQSATAPIRQHPMHSTTRIANRKHLKRLLVITLQSTSK